MILIADSGSTKVHWCLVTASGQCSDVFTDGINPLFQTTIAMQNSISNQLLPQIAPLLWAGTLTHVFFYGAGCTPEKKGFVYTEISNYCEGKIEMKDGMPLSTKKDHKMHGYGVRSMRYAAQKYGGSVIYENEDEGRPDWCPLIPIDDLK